MRAIGGLVINEGKILIVEDPQQGWLFPGGKPEKNEKDEECLKREFLEELSIKELKNIRFYKRYISQSIKHGREVAVDMYFVDLNNAEFISSSEIKQAVFTSAPENYKLIPTAKEIVQDLRKEKIL